MTPSETVQAALDALEASAPLRWRDPAQHDDVRAKHSQATDGLRALLAQMREAAGTPEAPCEHLHSIWGGPGRPVICESCGANLGSAPLAAVPSGWRPIATAPKDGTRFVWLRRVTTIAVGKPPAYHFEAQMVWRAWSADAIGAPREGPGYWMSECGSIPGDDIGGWWILPVAAAPAAPEGDTNA